APHAQPPEKGMFMGLLQSVATPGVENQHGAGIDEPWHPERRPTKADLATPTPPARSSCSRNRRQNHQNQRPGRPSKRRRSRPSAGGFSSRGTPSRATRRRSSRTSGARVVGKL